jgi:hypothetical protein
MELDRNMHKVLRFALLFTLLAPSLAWANDGFFVQQPITKEHLESLEVNVSIADNATGACWTNLKEVREYAEEKFRTLGVKVSETELMSADANIYWFTISVSASRVYQDGNGPCFGNYHIRLKGWTRINDVVHLAILGAKDTKPFIPSSETFNRSIIVGLEKVFASFPKK